MTIVSNAAIIREMSSEELLEEYNSCLQRYLSVFCSNERIDEAIRLKRSLDFIITQYCQLTGRDIREDINK